MFCVRWLSLNEGLSPKSDVAARNRNTQKIVKIVK